MRILIAEDDRLSRVFLKKFLSSYGTCDVAVDGMEALDAFMEAVKQKALLLVVKLFVIAKDRI